MLDISHLTSIKKKLLDEMKVSVLIRQTSKTNIGHSFNNIATDIYQLIYC